MKNFKFILMATIFLATTTGCEEYIDDLHVVTEETTAIITEVETTSEEETFETTEVTTTTTTEISTTAPPVTDEDEEELVSTLIEIPVIPNSNTEVSETVPPAIDNTITELSSEDTKAALSSFLDDSTDVTTTELVGGSEISEVTETTTEITTEKIPENFSETTTTTEVTHPITTILTEITLESDGGTGAIGSMIEPPLPTEIVVYKPRTNYIHRNTCSWYDDTCYKIETVEGLNPRICSKCKPNEIIEIPEKTEADPVSKEGMTYVKRFSRGTLYCYGGARKGGSGRQLINCAYGNDEVRGSIASSYLYKNYGYKYNGNRTKVYLELPNYPTMNGYYYLDDSNSLSVLNVIDFFCYKKTDLPFGADGTGVTPVECWIVE